MPAKRSNDKAPLQCVSEGWTLSRPAPGPAAAAPRAVRGAVQAAVPEWEPAFLQGAEFEVLDRGKLDPAPGRRGAATDSGSAVSLKMELPEGAVAFLVARQESGAISFHMPQRGAARRGKGAATKSVVTFDVAVSQEPAESGRRGFFSKIVKVIVVKVVDAIAGKLIQKATELAVPFLVEQLEKLLWRNRTQGWLRVTEQGLQADNDALAAGKPDFRSPHRGLLLIHGTFSTAHGGFRSLAGTNFFAEAKKRYGANIFAFNHFTMSKTPEENVAELLDALPTGEFEFDIITHSRGGLVARELLERSGILHPNRRRLSVRNVVMVASPSMGTPLASPADWEGKLSFFANIMEMLPVPENPFTTGASWIAEALKWVAANILGNTPGVVVMDPHGAYIDDLQDPPNAPQGTLYHAVVSNYHPPQEWLARLGDMGMDTLFGGANDLVVPTEGGWKTAGKVAGWVPGERVACSGPGGNFHTDLRVSLHHGSFFGEAEAVAAMLACMKDDATGLPRIDTERALPSRRVLIARRGDDGAVGARAVEVATGGGQVAAAEPRVAIAEVAVEGFGEEDVLSLTVISQILHSEVDDEKDSAVPMLMAQYCGARVTEPFLIRGEADDAGKRWQSLIRDHKKIVGYANGKGFVGKERGDVEGAINFPNEDFLKMFGMELFRTLFPGEVRNLYNIARFQHKKRRLKIVFTSMIPWVADMPWELAYDRSVGAFLACADVRFIRNVLSPTPVNKLTNKSSVLRILVVSAQPKGAGALSIEDERRGIHESFRPLIDAGLAEVEVLAGASPCALQERLRYRADGDEFDVLHFIGHGAFDPETRVGTLMFEDEQGRSKSVTATDFLNILRGRGIRIVFLNACETGRGEKADYNRGVAMELVRDGIPAVVANQYSVIDRSASLFSLHFYACLASGLNIADAMREARIALHYDGVEPMDWSVPVLFANNPDARLCRPVPRPALSGAESGEPFRILSRSTGGVRRAVGRKRKLISVWDAENALIYRENLEATLAELNEAQDEFEFHLERFTAPRGLWTVKSAEKSRDGVAYLCAENVMGRMEHIRKAIGSDYLFCVTNLPLRDEDTEALYYYTDPVDTNPAKVAILSTWDLSPPLEGMLLKKAIANHLAIFLLEDLSCVAHTPTGDDDPKHPIHTVGFWNGDRQVAHIAGQMRMTKATTAAVNATIKNGVFKHEQFDAIQSLLSMYQ